MKHILIQIFLLALFTGNVFSQTDSAVYYKSLAANEIREFEDLPGAVKLISKIFGSKIKKANLYIERALVFKAGDNEALFLSATGELNLVDMYDEKKQITLYEMDNDDYLLKDSKGYYKATRPAARLLHYVTSDLKVISFEQLDVKYNRPDKLLASSGSTDTSLIRSYQKAWNKRIRFLNIPEFKK